MDLVCKSCESKDFTVEGFERVCTNCGEVQDDLVDEGQLCMLPDNDAIEDNLRNKNYESNQRLTFRIRGEGNDAAGRRRINREKLLDESLKLVKQLIKDPSAIEETMDLIGATFAGHEGRLIHSRKIGLVGACIYYLGAKHQLGISLFDICKTLGVKMKVMNVCLKQVKSLCPDFEYERPNIKDLVKKFIDQLATKHYDLSNVEDNVDPSQTSEQTGSKLQPLITQTDKYVLYNRVILLIDLFEAMHPFSQPTPQCLILAVVYHAWKSLDTFKMIAINLSSKIQSSLSEPTAESSVSGQQSTSEKKAYKTFRIKHSISYERFCSICNIRYSKNGYRIVSKLQSSLLMLGQFLGDVNKVNLPWFLKDIIENSPHLIQEHLSKPDNKIDNK